MIKEKILSAGIAGINIERAGEALKVNIRSSRPGLIIGRGGKGIEDLKNFIIKKIVILRKSNKVDTSFTLNLNVEELKRREISAAVVAQQMAFDIERRLPYRLVLRRHLDTIKQNRDIKGAKLSLAGRLNGSEIARKEKTAFGRMPLQTIRADIDYGEATSFNTYGTIGVKVWLYKGEIFEEDTAS